MTEFVGLEYRYKVIYRPAGLTRGACETGSYNTLERAQRRARRMRDAGHTVLEILETTKTVLR